MAKRILEKISPYENIIWDWNGTLINDRDIAADAEAKVFKKYGLPSQTREERHKNFFMPIEKYYARMGFDFTKVSYDQVSEDWLQFYEELILEAPLFEEVSEMIQKLHEEGKRQFVLSAAPEDHLRKMIRKHALHDFFEGVYGLSNARADSKVARGKELIRDFKVETSKAILVGDTSAGPPRIVGFDAGPRGWKHRRAWSGRFLLRLRIGDVKAAAGCLSKSLGHGGARPVLEAGSRYICCTGGARRAEG